MVRKKELLKEAIELWKDGDDDQEDAVVNLAVFFIWATLTAAAKDTLRKLVEKGPIDDGDVPSKTGRDELLALGLGVKIFSPGGNNAATYAGRDVFEMSFIYHDVYPTAPKIPQVTPEPVALTCSNCLNVYPGDLNTACPLCSRAERLDNAQ